MAKDDNNHSRKLWPDKNDSWALQLPDGNQVLIQYKRRNLSVPDNRPNQVEREQVIRQTKNWLDTLCWELIEILNQFENIDDPKVLGGLLQIGFEVSETRPIMYLIRQNTLSTPANLSYLVKQVRSLEKLDVLIRSAQIYTNNPNLRNKLKMMEQEFSHPPAISFKRTPYPNEV